MQRRGDVVRLQRKERQDMTRHIHAVQHRRFGFGMVPGFAERWNERDDINGNDNDDGDRRIVCEYPRDETQQRGCEEVRVCSDDIVKSVSESKEKNQ